MLTRSLIRLHTPYNVLEHNVAAFVFKPNTSRREDSPRFSLIKLEKGYLSARKPPY